jgi:hypothetical protein
MFAELQSLGFSDLRNTLINFWDDAGNSLIDYDYSDFAGGNKAKLSYSSHPVFEQFQKKIKRSKDPFAKLVVKEDELESWKQRRRDSGEYEDARLNDIAALYYYFYSIGVGAIGISTFSSLTVEKLNLLKRFRNVFDLAYRRYQDIEKSEAQAREAKIEAALESVRASSMAMHHSEELEKVVKTLSDKLIDLGLSLDGALIFFFEKEKRNFHLWIATNQLPAPIKVDTPYAEDIQNNPIIKNLWEAIETGRDFINESYSGKVKDDYFGFVSKYNESKIPEAVRKFQLEAECWTFSCAAGKNSVVGIDSWSGKIITEQDFQVLKRFAKVFEQAYTRFLDLQKAEAQAREAKIELALERVRARAMAMQKSDELPEAANLLFLQVQALGMPAWSAGYCIWDEDKKAITLWMSSEGVMQPPFRAPLTEDPSFIHMREANERGESFFVEEIGGEELVEHYKYMRTLPVVGEILDSIIEAGHPLPTFQIFHLAYFSQGFLLFITYKPVPEAHDIFKRFGKVFDQTYTRFLDLQKAEAQAREAKIEAALERVRSRTMGMQISEELKEVIQVVYEQFGHLNIHIEHTGFIMDYKARDDMHIWLADKHEVPSEVTFPYFDSPHWNSFIEAKVEGIDFFANHLNFEEKNKFYQGLFNLFPALPLSNFE